MTKRARYLLLLVGFLIFMTGAPLIVLYVRGLTFDSSTGKFVDTGILAVRMDPDQAKVYVDDDLKLKKTGDIKFLKPGEYTVTIKKDGYFDWSKRFAIRANEVTWAQGASDKIHLIYRDADPKALAGGVSDFFTAGDTVVYSAGNSIVTTTSKNPSDIQTMQVPGTIISLEPSPSGNLAMVTTQASTTQAHLVYNRNSRALYDVHTLLASGDRHAFSNSDELFTLSEGTLYKTNLNDLTRQVVLQNVYTFTLHDNSIYFTQMAPSGAVLAISNLNGQNEQVIFPSVPLFKDSDIVANFQKEIFILGDGELYKVGTNLDRLAGGMSAWHFDPASSSLAVVHSGEFSYYNTFDHALSLVTRSGSSITTPLAYPSINHAFFVKDGQVITVEMDNRGQQNQNTLYQSPNIKKIQVSDDLKKLYVLDGDQLKEIRIR